MGINEPQEQIAPARPNLAGIKKLGPVVAQVVATATETVQIAAQSAGTGRASRSAGSGSHAAPGGTWECIRQRENSGSYTSHTDGAYQIIPSTWRSLSQSRDYATPASAPPAVQDAAAQELQARSGWSQWTTAGRCGVG